MKYIGLDFESSGSDPWGRSVPIQIGMAMEDDGTLATASGAPLIFSRYIGGWSWESNHNDPSAEWWDWSEEAEAVHGLARDSIALKYAEPVWAVDIQAAAWLLEFVGTTKRMFNITVGWNVAGFDRQFITRWMPNLNRLLSYRTLDLTALVFAQADDEAQYRAVKKAAKDAAHAALGYSSDQRHDALVDARCALVEKSYLIGQL